MTTAELVARALYYYDNGGRIDFDEADADTLAPYFDMAELALEVIKHRSHPDQLMARALGVCWHSPTSDRWPCQVIAGRRAT